MAESGPHWQDAEAHRRRVASAIWWLARGLRRLAGFDRTRGN